MGGLGGWWLGGWVVRRGDFAQRTREIIHSPKIDLTNLVCLTVLWIFGVGSHNKLLIIVKLYNDSGFLDI